MKKIVPMKIATLSILSFLQATVVAQYSGTGSITQGKATWVTQNIYTCSGAKGRTGGIGTITATDKTIWTVPAVVHFSESTFPTAPDLNNACTGKNYANATIALAALKTSDIVSIDADGEVVTAYVFADNYFEMYINGVPVGKDAVPYTEFNSSVMRFRVKQPFTIAMQLVDWEENPGLGTENNGFLYHAGDGGMVAVFKDASNNVLAITGKDWKAQTFYTSPLQDPTCVKENGTSRISSACAVRTTGSGLTDFALFWKKPTDWMTKGFDDSSWPSATTYTNSEIGVDNKPSYTNFTDIFDPSVKNPEFIWSSNVVLDNDVVVRYMVGKSTAIKGHAKTDENANANENILIHPELQSGAVRIQLPDRNSSTQSRKLLVTNATGQVVFKSENPISELRLTRLQSGIYWLKLSGYGNPITQKFLIP